MHITSSSPLLTATFPGQHDLFRAGDAIDLTAHLELALDNKGQSKLERVTAELRGTQITTYYASRPNPGPVGAQRRVDRRTEETILFSSIQTIWTPDQSHRFAPSASPSSSSSEPSIDIPVRFTFPLMALPPSFQGGSRVSPLSSRRRQVDGDEVARVVYFVKLHGVKSGTFTRDDRIILPLIYSPPAMNIGIPDTLVFGDLANSTPAPPSAPSVAQGWATLAIDHWYRERLLSKKNLLVVAFSGPTLPSVPIGRFYPFRLSLLTLSAPVSTHQTPTPWSDIKKWTRTPPSELEADLPDLAKIDLNLERQVTTTARGATQSFVQTVGPAFAFAHERRVWYGPAELLDMDDYNRQTGGARDCKPGEKRWAIETVIIGEMLLGKLGTHGISPSFGPEVTRGLLMCSYHLSLRIPCKGIGSTLDANPFIPIVLSAQEPGMPADLSDVPPDYYSGAGSGFDDAKVG